MKTFQLLSGRCKLSVYLFLFLIPVFGFGQPTITSFSPASGPVGSSVSINGTNFSTTISGNIVFFGPVKANISSATSTTLQVTVPAGADYRPITVNSNGLSVVSGKPFDPTFPGSAGSFGGSSFIFTDTIPAENAPTGVNTMDFDGDGKPDVAFVNQFKNSLFVFQNQSSAGSFSFSQKINAVTPSLPVYLTTGDIDGDGKPDIVVVGDSVAIYKNNSTPGNINFQRVLDIGSASPPGAPKLHDLDGDGKPELIVAGSSQVSVYVNSSSVGNISFANAGYSGPPNTQSGGISEAIEVNDFDGDGKADIALVHLNHNDVGILPNLSTLGNIQFGAIIAYQNVGTLISQMRAEDVNGDGLTDLTFSNAGSNTGITYILNSSTPGHVSFNTGALGYFPVLVDNATDYSFGDLDGDGYPDITEGIGYSILDTPSLKVFRRVNLPNTLALESPVSYPAKTNSQYGNVLALTDLDGDGKPEIILGVEGYGSTNYTLLIYRNRTGPTTIYSVSPLTGTHGSKVKIAGNNLAGVSSVYFGAVAADSFRFIAADTIIATVGNGATGTISLINNTTGDAATFPGFVYVSNNPLLTSFAPDSAAYGTTIEIYGHNLSNVNSVILGGIPALSFRIISDSVISVEVGRCASGNITVTNAAGSASLPGFVYINTFFSLDSWGGTIVEGHAELNWTSSNDEKIYTYQVQYGYDSANLSIVYTTTPNSTHSYSFTDPQNPRPTNYYRLFITDKIGITSYSGILSLPYLDSTKSLALAPNPAKGSTQVTIPISSQNAVVKVYDMSGRKQKEINIPPNTWTYTLYLADLNGGTYILVWSDGTRQLAQKFIVSP